MLAAAQINKPCCFDNNVFQSAHSCVCVVIKSEIDICSLHMSKYICSIGLWLTSVDMRQSNVLATETPWLIDK